MKYPNETIGPFRVGGLPAPAAITFDDENSEPVDLTGAEVSAVLNPGAVDLAAVVTGNAVTVTFAEGFTTAGIFDIEVTINGDIAEPLEFVVEQRDGWLTLAQARREWSDAPIDDVRCYRLLEAAKTACVAYAPALPVDDTGAIILPLPLSYAEAQLMQARNILNVAKTDPAQSPDGTLFVIRPYPLDNFIKQLLRPKRAVPVVG